MLHALQPQWQHRSVLCGFDCLYKQLRSSALRAKDPSGLWREIISTARTQEPKDVSIISAEPGLCRWLLMLLCNPATFGSSFCAAAACSRMRCWFSFCASVLVERNPALATRGLFSWGCSSRRSSSWKTRPDQDEKGVVKRGGNTQA